MDNGACASPVIETVGSRNLLPKSPEEILSLLKPVISEIGMLTFQASGTTSRSNVLSGMFNKEQVQPYINCVREIFNGTIQIQGGITTSTICEAVKLGAEFLVCGTQLFRNHDGLSAPEVVDQMLIEVSSCFSVDNHKNAC